MKIRKARIVYIHAETGTEFQSGWMGRKHIDPFWRWLMAHGVVIGRTEVR